MSEAIILGGIWLIGWAFTYQVTIEAGEKRGVPWPILVFMALFTWPLMLGVLVGERMQK